MTGGRRATSVEELEPRSRLPQPLVPQRPTCACCTAKDAEERLKDVLAENQLLGQLVQNSQAEAARLNGQLKAALAQQATRDAEALALTRQLRDAEASAKALQAQCDKLRSTSSEHASQTARERARVSELERLVVELTREGQAKAQAAQELQARCDQLGQRVQQLQAAGASAEHISAQLERVEGLYRARVDALKRDHAQRLAGAEKRANGRLAALQGQAGQLLGQLRQEAAQEVARAETALEAKARDQLRVLEQLAKRCGALEGVTRSLQAQRSQQQLSAQATGGGRMVGGLWLPAGSSSTEVQELRRQVALLQAERDAALAAQAGLEREVDEARSRAADSQQRELSALQRVGALRGELVAQAETAQRLHAEVAGLQVDKVAAAEGRAEAEQTVQALRREVQELRLHMARSAALRDQQALQVSAAGAQQALVRVYALQPGQQQQQGHGPHTADLGLEAAAAPAAPGGGHAATAGGGGGAVRGQQEALEVALEGALQREAAALEQASAALAAEARAGEALAAARHEQLAAARALLQQLRRMHALEALRLQDMQELHQREKQLALLADELWAAHARSSSLVTGGRGASAAGPGSTN